MTLKHMADTRGDWASRPTTLAHFRSNGSSKTSFTESNEKQQGVLLVILNQYLQSIAISNERRPLGNRSANAHSPAAAAVPLRSGIAPRRPRGAAAAAAAAAAAGAPASTKAIMRRPPCSHAAPAWYDVCARPCVLRSSAVHKLPCGARAEQQLQQQQRRLGWTSTQTGHKQEQFMSAA